MSERIESLRRAVEANTADAALRLMLAEELRAADRIAEALAEYETLLNAGELPAESLLDVGELAAAAHQLPLLRTCAAFARHVGIVEGAHKLEQLVDDALLERDVVRVPAGSAAARLGEFPASDIETLTFDQVGGMAEVKRIIHRMIILPLSRPELYAKYGRKAGGGVVLYGPPGCGKTLLARATAGECGLPFVNVRIEDVLDPYQGMSERNLHTAFETARAQAPSVLFLDELDALAFARHKHHGSDARRLVDALLQELDAIGSDNDGVLVLAATNAPWDVDEAMLRPGRLDKVLFVPPPDEQARAEIVRVLLNDVPTEGVDVEQVAATTPLCSGADLDALVRAAVDRSIEHALATGAEPPVGMPALRAAGAEIRPSTLDWLNRAKAYVEFANQSERYTDVADYLTHKEVRKRLGR